MSRIVLFVLFVIIVFFVVYRNLVQSCGCETFNNPFNKCVYRKNYYYNNPVTVSATLKFKSTNNNNVIAYANNANFTSKQTPSSLLIPSCLF